MAVLSFVFWNFDPFSLKTPIEEFDFQILRTLSFGSFALRFLKFQLLPAEKSVRTISFLNSSNPKLWQFCPSFFVISTTFSWKICPNKAKNHYLKKKKKKKKLPYKGISYSTGDRYRHFCLKMALFLATTEIHNKCFLTCLVSFERAIKDLSGHIIDLPLLLATSEKFSFEKSLPKKRPLYFLTIARK